MVVTILVGALCGVATAMLVARFAAERYRGILAVFLAVIAALYSGPMIAAGESLLHPEQLFAGGLVILSIVALRTSLLVLAAGYALHGLWDLLHGPVMAHVMPEWYAPLCVGFDLSVAACIVFEYQRRQRFALVEA